MAHNKTDKYKVEIECVKEDTTMMKKNSDGCSSNGVEEVRWERFLPRMMLTVMVVEADDSTRQIIVALLRKCSYNGKCGFFNFFFPCIAFRFVQFS